MIAITLNNIRRGTDMNKLATKENVNNNVGIKKNFFTLCLLSFAGSIIYALPYFRGYFYDAYKALYHLTNYQMGALGSAYGLLGVFSYIIGGILADKFQAKKLLIISLFATGLGGFTHLFFTDFKTLAVIYGLWGFTSLLTFWPALVKIIRMLAKEDEQSRAYGIFEGGRGVVNAVHMAIATAIFGYFQSKMAVGLGIQTIIIFYSICPIICGILFIFLLKDNQEEEKKEEKKKIRLKDYSSVLKMPAVWMAIVITFCSYVFNMSFYYFTPYATNVIGTSAVFAAILTVIAQYCRPFSSAGGGFLADKFGKAIIMFIGFVAMAIGTTVLIFISNVQGQLAPILLVVVCTVIYVAMFSNFGIYFSLLSEAKIPIEYSGVAIGLVATLGYLPEVLCPMIAGKTLDMFTGSKGYHIYFTGMVIVAIIGAIFCVLWMKMYSSKNKKNN